MGLVIRQVFNNSVVVYLSVCIGVLAQLFIYPQDLALKGQLDTVMKAALLISPFTLLGMNTVAIRYTPQVKDGAREGAAQLLWRSLLVMTVALAIFASLLALIGEDMDGLLSSIGLRQQTLLHYRWEMVGFMGGIGYVSIFKTYLKNRHSIGLAAVYENLLPKLLIPALFVAAVNEYFSSNLYVRYTVLGYAVIVLLMAANVRWKYALRVRWRSLQFSREKERQMATVAAFSIFGSFGGVLMTNIDTIAVNSVMGDFETGIYSFAVFAVSIMIIPYNALNGIASPIISRYWNEGEVGKIGELYRMASQVLFFTAGGIFVALMVCLPQLYELTSNLRQLAPGYVVVGILGVAYLFDQLTSVNTILIGFSDRYRWNLAFILLLGTLNVVLNYLFLIVYGMGFLGAALATSISLLLFNLIKGAAIYRWFGIHPLSTSLGYTALFLGGLGAAVYQLPEVYGALPTAVLKVIILAAGCFCFIRFTNAVPPMQKAIRKGLKGLFE
jgi:O-antigen/teichoic acid export membrane protein